MWARETIYFVDTDASLYYSFSAGFQNFVLRACAVELYERQILNETRRKNDVVRLEDTYVVDGQAAP